MLVSFPDRHENRLGASRVRSKNKKPAVDSRWLAKFPYARLARRARASWLTVFVLLRPDWAYLVTFVQEEFVLLRFDQDIVLCLILRFEPYHQRQLFGSQFKHAHGDFERARCESVRLGRNSIATLFL